MVERLEIRDVSKSFGGLIVASNINLTLEEGARTALIGPNGAGKTTLVNLISGSLSPSAGSIILDGKAIAGLSHARRVRAGIVRTFQINRLFKDMTVGDNLRIALLQKHRMNLRLWRDRSAEEIFEREAEESLSSLGLQSRTGHLVRSLAYGEQRLLEIALALALKPRVLLLDEPAAGVPKTESSVIVDVIARLPSDLAILLIEHDMDLVFRFARRIVVLASGAVVMTGEPQEVAADARVRQLYLGRKRETSRDGH